MDNFRDFINKNNDALINPENFEFITQIDKRVRLVYFIGSIYYKIFQKTLLTINNVNRINNDNQGYVFLLNILLIILKQYTVQFDFVNYNKELYRDISSHNSYDIYSNKLDILVEKEKNIIEKNQLVNRNIDLVISAGGNVGFYMLGATNILKKINVHVQRISGVSMGALIGYFYLMFDNNEIALDIYHKIFEHYKNNPDDRRGAIYYMYNYWCNYIRDVIDKEFYKKCNDKLFIGYSEINKNGLFFRVKSNYTSNDDIMLTCLASGSIPFMSIDGLCLLHNGKTFLDGALLKSKFMFEDNKNDQMVMNLYNVDYDYEKILLPVDENIVDFMYKGAEDMIKFLHGNKSEVLFMVEKEKN